MNKEELIRNLKYTKEKHKNDFVPTFGTNISLMCEDILNYLEGEPCEDAVSREAVLMEIDKYMCGVPYDEKGIDVVLKELPHVTPARKKGKWICVHHIENKITYDSWKCSECQHDFNSEEESMVYFNEYKYCPNCGAEMEREE